MLDIGDRRLLMVTGKGGTGKSLLASVLAFQQAAAGRRTLLAESSAHDQLSRSFGLSRRRHVEQKVHEDLWVINLDPLDCFREYVEDHLGMSRLYRTVFTNKVVHSFLEAIPGLSEVMLLGRLYYSAHLARKRRYDLVVFDGPASGHFLSLLATPQAVKDSGLGGPLVGEVTRVDSYLRDPALCGVIVAALAQELVVSETRELLAGLEKSCPSPLLSVVLNRAPTYRAVDPESVAEDQREVARYIHRREERFHRFRDELAALVPGQLRTFAEFRALPNPLPEAVLSTGWPDAPCPR